MHILTNIFTKHTSVSHAQGSSAQDGQRQHADPSAITSSDHLRCRWFWLLEAVAAPGCAAYDRGLGV